MPISAVSSVDHLQLRACAFSVSNAVALPESFLNKYLAFLGRIELQIYQLLINSALSLLIQFALVHTCGASTMMAQERFFRGSSHSNATGLSSVMVRHSFFLPFIFIKMMALLYRNYLRYMNALKVHLE